MAIVMCLFMMQARAGYVQNVVAQTAWQTVTTNTWAAPDDANILVPIGFTFNFNNVNYTNVYINSNGVLNFTTGTSAYANAALPSAPAADSILPYWDDMYAPGGGNITYGTVGTAPNRQFVVSWNAVRLYSNTGYCTFQVVLGEDQSIRFRYSTASTGCNGSASATTGVQESAASYYQRSFNTAIPLNQDVLYLRTSTVSVQKTVAIVCDTFNGASNPKNLPGSISRWTISVTNVGAAAVNLTQIADTLDAGVVFDTNLVAGASAATCNRTAPPGVPLGGVGRGFNINITGSTRTGFPKFLTSASDGDGATFTAPNSVLIDFLTALPVATGYTAGQLKPGETVTVYFNVVLN